MSGIREFVQRHSFLTFVILAYLLSWWPAITPFMQQIDLQILPHGPSIAAIIVVAIVNGGAGVKSLLRRLLPKRAHLKWYALGMGMTIVITLAAVALNVLLGGEGPTSAELATWPERLPFFIFAFLMFGATEELGWRGFAQDRLQQNRSALSAALLVAVVGVTWHLPLFLSRSIELPDIPLMFAGYVVYAWLFNSTGGGVLVTMLTHATNNTVSGEYFSQMFEGGDRVRQSALLAVLWLVAAIVVTVLAGKELGRKQAASPAVPMSADQPVAAQ
jgi:membrane protease YdiL (CAAX protease family)